MLGLLALCLGSCSLVQTKQARAWKDPNGEWQYETTTTWNKRALASLGAGVLCASLDVISTEVALNAGAVEGNPLLQERAVRIPLVLATAPFFWWLGESRGHPWLGYGNALIHCGAAGWNFWLAGHVSE